MMFFNYGDYVKPKVQWNAGKVAVGIITVMYLINFCWLVAFILSTTRLNAKLALLKRKNLKRKEVRDRDKVI